ncbi:MAG: hypothetical protein K8H74_12355 [Notoacmeibacter sp.]|nr:hypothetical protein [Notoacmeibacter sp.]
MTIKVKSSLLSALMGISFLQGCASKPENISASYISPLTYQNYTCDQLAQEAGRVSTRAAEMAGVQEKKATNDAVAVGVGVVLFWPALFFVKGNRATEAEFSRLKGEMEAIEKAAIQKGCNIQFNRN